ncbi:MAG: hypothetical protein WCK09_13550 [Bacteroidota bacterium]
MFNSSVLEVVIGLVFIFLLYSLLATIIQEMIASAFAFRSKILERAIFKMLEDENKFSSRISSIFYLFKKTGNGGEKDSTSFEFYNHPLIKFLGENKSNSRPSYITRETFSKVLIDLLRGDKVKPGDDINLLIQKALDENVTNWGKSEISKETLSYLKSMWADAQGDVDKFKGYLENWFDETMDRASGWYKKNTQVILFFIGLLIAIVFNVDTITIVGKLEKDPKLREQIVQQADVFVKAHPDLSKEIADQKTSMENLLFEIEKNRNTPKGDSLIRLEKQESYNLIRTKELQKKREALLKQADSLVKTDIGKSNEILGLGWDSHRSNAQDFQGFLLALLGWLITALALSLGAPFWFDILNKVMKVRNSVAKDTK